MSLPAVVLCGFAVLAAGCGRLRPDLGAQLVKAAEIQDLPRVRELLDAGVPADSTYERPWPVGGRAGPALRIAVAAGNDAMMRLLIDRGADLDFAEALATAASYGRRETVQFLLERGADPAATDVDGRTAFVSALLYGQLDIATDLAERERPGVLVAVLTGQVEAVADAAAKSMDAPGLPGLTLLHVAARAGQTPVVERLLDLGAPIEAACEPSPSWLGSPLMLAAREGRAETVRLLLDRGADPNQMVGKRSILVVAAGAGRDEIVRLLVSRGARVDREQDLQPPLCAAAVEGRVDAIAALLDLGAAIDRPNAGHRTPLRLAAGQAHAPAVELLMDRGATVDPKLAAEIRNLPFPPAGPERMEHIARLLERRGR